MVSKESSGRSFGFGNAGGDLKGHYLSAATQFFRPELVNRLDQIVAYHPLTPEQIRLIASRVLERAVGREGLSRRGVTVRWDDAVVDRLAVLGLDARYGARPLKRAVEQHVVSVIAAQLARSGPTPPSAIHLRVQPDGAIAASS